MKAPEPRLCGLRYVLGDVENGLSVISFDEIYEVTDLDVWESVYIIDWPEDPDAVDDLPLCDVLLYRRAVLANAEEQFT